MRERRLAIGAAVVLTLAMIAIAVLGLAPKAKSAVIASPRTSTARVTVQASKPARHQLKATAAKSKKLAGKVVGVDPGHNGRNWSDPTYIDRQIWNGREYEDCNTTGTETDGGYTESLFNWRVGEDLAKDLRAEGAKVVMTRHSNRGVGPCVNKRAAIFNKARVAVGVAIHADGGPADGRGFTVLEPVKDGINSKSVPASRRFDHVLAKTFGKITGMPYSTYDGVRGLEPRDDLAGENLTKRPYALIECANMRNATDARLLVRKRFQEHAARGIAIAITKFLTHR